MTLSGYIHDPCLSHAAVKIGGHSHVAIVDPYHRMANTMSGLATILRRVSTASTRTRQSKCIGFFHQHHMNGRISSLKWLSSTTDSTTITAAPSSPSEIGASSNNSINSTTIAMASVAVASLAVAAAALTGTLSIPTAKKANEKSVPPIVTTNNKEIDEPLTSPVKTTSDDGKSSKVDEKKKKEERLTTPQIPPNSFVQASDFWDIRFQQQTQKQKQQTGMAPMWKDGLVYDDPSQDEPSDCEMCNTFRHGPCRPYQRATDYCLKEQEELNVKDPANACHEKILRLYQECLRLHAGFYRLVDNYRYQQRIDPHEWNERRRRSAATVTNQSGVIAPLDLTTLQQAESLLVDRAKWMEHVNVNWSNWTQYVQVHGWRPDQLQDMLQQQQLQLKRAQEQFGIIFGPSWWKNRPVTWMDIMDQILDAANDADFSTLLSPPAPKQPQPASQSPSSSSQPAGPYWQYLEDDPDPVLISLTASCPKVDHKTGYPLLAAYVRDAATGRLLGHVTAPPPDATSSKSPQPTNTEGTSTLDSKANKEQPSVQEVIFQIVPGWTESIRVCAVYQERDDNEDDSDRDDDLGIMFRESPRMSLVDALKADYQLLEHDPQRLADRFRLIRNYLEWTSQDPPTNKGVDKE